VNWYDYVARFYDPATVRTPTPDPHSENFYSESSYSFLGNNPISNIDPTGMDWYNYTDDKGNVHYKYQDGRDEIEGYTNIGSSVNIEFGEGFYYNAFQNYGFTTIDAPTDAKGKILGSASLQDKLLSEGSGFSAQGQAEIMTELIHQGKSDLINHPATQAALSGLLFVATGGIEGAASLLNAGRSLLAKGAGGVAAKGGMTELQLVTKAAQKAEAAIGGSGGVAGTLKHTYAKNLLSRYQSIYGDRGLSLGSNYFNGPAGKGFLDVVNHNTGMIYDFKFGNAFMSNAQYLKYSNSFPGYGIQVIRP
jgi:hypothetical protein